MMPSGLNSLWIELKSYLNSFNEELPEGLKDFFYALGGTPLFLFFLQAFTGIFLLIYYIPSYESAYESVYRITYTIPMGWWIRGLHRYGANLFIFTVFLHIIRTFVTRSYSSPREFTWVIGGMIFFSSLGAGFTGYSLINDQLSYWATRVGTEIAESLPLLGKPISILLKGGEKISQFTISRLFTMHIFIIPLFLFSLIILHILFVRRYGISIKSEKKYPLIPEHLYLEINIFIFLFTTITILSAIFPPDLGEKANPLRTPPHIKPEWYFYPVFLFLKAFPIRIGITMLAIFSLLFLLYPFLEKALEKFQGKFPTAVLRTVGFLIALYFAIAIIKESIY